jgi:hypothetical protein
MRSGLAIALCFYAAACLPIPHKHLVRPQATFQVHDSAGHAIPGAYLRVYGGLAVGRKVRWTQLLIPDSAGVATLERKRERHMLYLVLPDAEAPWTWAWCVEAPGYEAATGELTGEPTAPVAIALSPRKSVWHCPDRPAYLTAVRRPQPQPRGAER